MATAKVASKSKLGLTLKQMARVTPKPIHNNSAYVKITSHKTLNVKGTLNPVLRVNTVYSTHDHTGAKKTEIEKYQCRVEGLEGPNKKIHESRCTVACECPYFMFYCEYALTQHGASRIFFSNGAPPVDKNPRLIPWVCKHLLKAFAFIQHTKR
jgi:hypothetical protein